jgi:hypothetical protein
LLEGFPFAVAAKDNRTCSEGVGNYLPDINKICFVWVRNMPAFFQTLLSMQNYLVFMMLASIHGMLKIKAVFRAGICLDS